MFLLMRSVFSVSAEVDGNGVFGTTPSDCFNALATLVLEILWALASWARLKPRARSRSKAGRSISIGLRPNWRPSSLACLRPARTGCLSTDRQAVGLPAQPARLSKLKSGTQFAHWTA